MKRWGAIGSITSHRAFVGTDGEPSRDIRANNQDVRLVPKAEIGGAAEGPLFGHLIRARQHVLRDR